MKLFHAELEGVGAAKLIILLLILLFIFVIYYYVSQRKRYATVKSLFQVTDNEGIYNVYAMDIKYDYDLNHVLDADFTNDDEFIRAVLGESVPFLSLNIKMPRCGCSAFNVKTSEEKRLTGRNYDFRRDSSALIVLCHPKNGFKSVAVAALDNVGANQATLTPHNRYACLTSPFICLDGMNEKGVSISVLSLDSEPTYQENDLAKLATPLAIRLVLDKAISTANAIDLLQTYDMMATGGQDYHFFITDAKGDSAVVEYDPEAEDRKLTVTRDRAVTNFYNMYIQNVQPNQKNGIYGHGKERYDAITEILDRACGVGRNGSNGDNAPTNATEDTVWEALKASSQEPKDGDVTSNTQWSVIYDQSDLTMKLVHRRNWEQVISFDLKTNVLRK